ncbi:hypothetical protein Tco_1265452 [Tanacetum coccineum]
MDECVSMSTPMATERLDADLLGTPTDQTNYRRMIGGLMYLTTSRPDIAFATFVFTMAQSQRQSDVHQDELCPLNKSYALMDANKKIDLDNLFCPNESKIIANILQHHPLRFYIDASSSVPWIYLEKFWHTLKEDRSKYRLKFMLFSEMVPFFLNDLGFTLELRSPSNFKTTDYAELLFEGLHYVLEHPSTLIPYPRFTKLIVGHYMTAYPKILRRVHDRYHNLEHDEMVKSIFNSGKNKAGVGMKIPS